MKTTKIVAILAIFMLALSAGHAQQALKESVKISFRTNMDCEGCKNKIEKNLAYEKGVTDLEVDLEKNIVTVEFKSWKTDSVRLRKAIEELGYRAVLIAEEPGQTNTKKE